jgi:hypothetical protein
LLFLCWGEAGAMRVASCFSRAGLTHCYCWGCVCSHLHVACRGKKSETARQGQLTPESTLLVSLTEEGLYFRVKPLLGVTGAAYRLGIGGDGLKEGGRGPKASDGRR